ncbi:uncharacterized protein METZ01_LOCUS388578, partial [marine metagenome]
MVAIALDSGVLSAQSFAGRGFNLQQTELWHS